MSKKYLKLILALVLVAILIISAIFISNKNKLPEGIINEAEAKEIVSNIISVEEERSGQVAYLWTKLLKKGDKVTPWDNDPEFPEDYQTPTTIEKYTWMAWIDLSPGNPFFAHPTQFVYIDALTGKYHLEDQEFWPSINDESFEGEIDEMITPVGKDKIAYNFNLLSKEKISKLLGIDKALAQGGGEKLKLNIEQVDKEKGEIREHYAFIISGYGKNTWVFLEGAHIMYQKLIDIGYKKKNIIFIGPGKKKLDPSWDKEGRAKLLDSSSIDGYTSPGNITKVLNVYSGKKEPKTIKDIKEGKGVKKLKETDSLFIFILAHGKKGYLASGQKVTKRQKMGTYDIRKGSRGRLSMRNFAEASIKNMDICELMILYDACYSGSYKKYFEEITEKNQDRPKRTAIGFSTDAKTISYGADYTVYTTEGKYEVIKIYTEDLDKGAPKTPIVDKNAADVGGEFSSGFILGMDTYDFKKSYDNAIDNDAALANKLTAPSYWYHGESGSCILEEPKIAPPETPKLQDDPETNNEPEPEDEPEPEKKTKTISILIVDSKEVPFNQFKPYPKEHCDCCGVEAHYHARNGSHVTALDGTRINDPFNNCGYGSIFNLPTKRIEVEIE